MEVLGPQSWFGRASPDLLSPSCCRVQLPLGSQASGGAGCFRPPVSPASPALPQSSALIAAFSCTTERKEEKTPTYVVPTRDSDMLTSLLYPVSNLNTEGAPGRSRKPVSNGLSGLATSLLLVTTVRTLHGYDGFPRPTAQVTPTPSPSAFCNKIFRRCPALTYTGPWERAGGFLEDSLWLSLPLLRGGGCLGGSVADSRESLITEGRVHIWDGLLASRNPSDLCKAPSFPQELPLCLCAKLPGRVGFL